MRPHLAALLLALPLATQAQTAADIMARVAANQDTSEAERAHYLYTQHARVTSHRGKTVMCEETTDFRVTPGTAKSQQTLLKLDGRILKKKQYVTYTDLAKNPDNINNDDEMDKDLVENLRHNLTDDKSKDGIHAGLFPLTTKAQSQYDFVLKGQERRNGHDTFHIAFTPKDQEDFGWRGDVWIDTTAYQPVFLQTALSRNIPFAVRTLLGTSVPGLGFAASYTQQPDGLWFPTTFGSEFKINVLFFFHRTVTLNVENRDFEKTHVTSRIVETANTTEAPAATPAEQSPSPVESATP